MHCPLLIADYFIAQSGGRLTPLQVIKLVHIAHGYSLALRDKPLVDEPVEGWRYGPVVPSVYHSARKYGGCQIPRLLYLGTRANGTDGAKMFEEYIPPQDRDILDRVLEVYGEASGSELIDMTHGSGSPWNRYCRARSGDREIPDEAIKAHYSRVVRDRNIRYR